MPNQLTTLNSTCSICQTKITTDEEGMRHVREHHKDLVNKDLEDYRPNAELDVFLKLFDECTTECETNGK